MVKFAGSTGLVPMPERAFMFPETPPATPFNGAARWAELNNGKTKILDGDYDVFGDGWVVILARPGHTPGHQSLLVNPEENRPGDTRRGSLSPPAERQLKNFTSFANGGDPAQEALSKAKIDALIKQKHAKLRVQHDIIADAKLCKSSALYE